ncbi:MAG TPA: dolichyl-phosphate beta-glucosyltransferase [Longilinea sp.]|nr:dolichyl-phosphate beta-glucosyltransferase [Longilinea sp.]
MSHPLLSLILPAHNEETRLPQCLDKVDQFLKKQPYTYEVIVVENGSRDDTLRVAQSYTSRLPYLKVIHETNRGKGLAVRTGMLAAQGDYRFFADVDFSMPIEELPRFFPPQFPDAQITIASREAPGAVRYDEPEIRHLTGRVFNNLVRIIALSGLQDSQCGFKCFRADAAEAAFSRQTIMGWTFDVEVLFIARLHHFNITEVPIPWYYKSESKIRLLNDSWHMFWDLLSIRWKSSRGQYN